jgi:hypothetical protein
MFRSTAIIRELVLNLAKVIFMLKHSVKLRRYMLCGDVVACLRAECILWAVQDECFNINITLARFSTSSLVMVVDRNMYNRLLCVF